MFNATRNDYDLRMVKAAQELVAIDGGHPEYTRGMVDLIIDRSHRFTNEDLDLLTELIEGGVER